VAVRQRPTRETLTERAIQEKIERGSNEPGEVTEPSVTEKRVGVLLKMPVSLKDRLDRHLRSLPIKRASWILMAIYEKLEQDEKG
jgi:hypothetical protein